MALSSASCHHCCAVSRLFVKKFHLPLTPHSCAAKHTLVKTPGLCDKKKLNRSLHSEWNTDFTQFLNASPIRLLNYSSCCRWDKFQTLLAARNSKEPHRLWYHTFSVIPVHRPDVHSHNMFHVKLPLLFNMMTADMRVITRSYHGSKFSIQNPVFSSYLENLFEEYKALSSDLPDQPSKDKDEQQIMRINFLRSVVEVIEIVQTKQAEVQELSNMMNGEEDQEMKKMMEKELEKYSEEMQELEAELADVLVGEDPADSNDTVLEVTAGVGGQEAMLFSAEVFNMYRNYAQYKGWNITGLTIDENELGGFRKASVEISGLAVYRHLKHEAGVHRVQRVPKTEKAGRVHTSTITVAVLPQPREIDVDIQPKDLKIDTFRGSGPGGQSVNTTDSAVRITHIPTGTVAECKQERSQIKNRDIALKNLKRKMYQAILEEEELKRRTTRKMHMGTRARSEKIRTYNFQQDRITDHRVKENCSNLSEFMLGGEGLDNLIDSLNDQDKFLTLESMLDEYELELSRKKSGKS